MASAATIARIITPTIEALGFDLVRVQLSGTHRPTLQIMAEPSDGGQMSVEHCAMLSRAVSAVLDVEDPIAGAYSLEVSSPGIDRPLTRARDYARHIGHEVKLETTGTLDGRKRIRGSILEAGETEVRLRLEDGEIALPYDSIAKAKLVLTDALIAHYQSAREESGGPASDDVPVADNTNTADMPAAPAKED